MFSIVISDVSNIEHDFVLIIFELSVFLTRFDVLERGVRLVINVHVKDIRSLTNLCQAMSEQQRSANPNCCKLVLTEIDRNLVRTFPWIGECHVSNKLN